MSYKCPVCNRVTSTSMNLARHMMSVFDEEHIDWIERKGLDPRNLMDPSGGRGNYTPLAELLEREARIDN